MAQTVKRCCKCLCDIWPSSETTMLCQNSSSGLRTGCWKLSWPQISRYFTSVNSVYYPAGTHDEKGDKHTTSLSPSWCRTNNPPFPALKSGVLSLNHPSLEVGELSGGKHLEWSEGPQKRGLAATCRLCSKARTVLMLIGLGQPRSLPPV